jgi:hypothetical protein
VSYFGNGVVFTKATVSSATEMNKMDMKEISQTLRKATIEQSNPQRLNDVVLFLEQHPDKGRIMCGGSPFYGSDFLLSSWAKFPVYQSGDFGLGQPIYAGPPSFTRSIDGMGIILPAPQNGLDFVIGLRTEHMEIFSKLIAEAANFS